MPYVRVEPEMFLEHGGVEVFHVYRDGTNEPWSYWFTIDPDTADDGYAHGKGGHFDVRRFVGRWENTPNVAQWDEWWQPRFKTEDDAVKALICTAIDQGHIAPSPIKGTSDV